MPPNSWYLMPQVEYYAGRYFTHDGVEYIPGQQLPKDKVLKWSSVEAAIRGRYLIPICADYQAIPRHMWGEAQAFETVLRKHQERTNRLNLPALEQQTQTPSAASETPQAPAEPDVVYDPSEHTVASVLDYVDEHPEQTERVLEAEENGKNRSTLISALEERLTAPEV